MLQRAVRLLVPPYSTILQTAFIMCVSAVSSMNLAIFIVTSEYLRLRLPLQHPNLLKHQSLSIPRQQWSLMEHHGTAVAYDSDTGHHFDKRWH